MKRLIVIALIALAPVVSAPKSAIAGRCNYPDDLDSRGHCCGGRAANVRPGGYEPTPEYPSSGAMRSGNMQDQNPNSQIEGIGYAGSCAAKSEVNLRSGPHLGSNVIGNTGDNQAAVAVHTTEMHDGALWSWVTVNGTNAWVRSDLLYGCS